MTNEDLARFNKITARIVVSVFFAILLSLASMRPAASQPACTNCWGSAPTQVWGLSDRTLYLCNWSCTEVTHYHSWPFDLVCTSSRCYVATVRRGPMVINGIGYSPAYEQICIPEFGVCSQVFFA